MFQTSANEDFFGEVIKIPNQKHLAASVSLNWQQCSKVLLPIFRTVRGGKESCIFLRVEKEDFLKKLFPHSSQSLHKEDPMATARPTVCLQRQKIKKYPRIDNASLLLKEPFIWEIAWGGVS